jgi:hypothetical protein
MLVSMRRPRVRGRPDSCENRGWFGAAAFIQGKIFLL